MSGRSFSLRYSFSAHRDTYPVAHSADFVFWISLAARLRISRGKGLASAVSGDASRDDIHHRIPSGARKMPRHHFTASLRQGVAPTRHLLQMCFPGSMPQDAELFPKILTGTKSLPRNRSRAVTCDRLAGSRHRLLLVHAGRDRRLPDVSPHPVRDLVAGSLRLVHRRECLRLGPDAARVLRCGWLSCAAAYACEFPHDRTAAGLLTIHPESPALAISARLAFCLGG